MKDNVLALFPTPVLTSTIDRDFSKEEKIFFNKERKNVTKNHGNYTSKSRYVLESKELKELKNNLHICIGKYFEQITQTKNFITPYITQSWLNFTKSKEHHHIHYHPNSYLSGVLYIDTDEKYDSIVFHKEKNEQISLIVKNHNIFNSVTWKVPVKKGMIVLFPSNLVHSVESKNGKNLRTSLAFNIFLKGQIGSYEGSTELFI